MWIQLGFNGVNIELNETSLNTIQFFPNPAKDYIEITSNGFLQGETSINIYNVLGEIVRSYEYSDFGNSQKINLEELAVGSYVVEFENNKTTSQHRLMVQ